MKRLEDESKENKERWLLTYADMITLLLIFFIVMYTISNINAQKFSQVASSLSKTFTGTDYIIGDYSGKSIVPGNMEKKSNLGDVQNQVNAFIKENNLQGMVSDYIDERGLVISLQDSLLFDLGSADVHQDEKQVLVKIGTMLKDLPNQIRIEGFTDNLPIHNNKFDSNWELSVIRATNVLKILIQDSGISPNRISAIGYGEFRPVAPNDTEDNRKLNRRVDIVIMNTDYNKWEPKQ
ncbi:MAG: OmpA/MotB family protein [Thermoanaerobacteraceae bacterium]